MSLKNIVNQTFKKFTDYKNPDQAMTQMMSLGSLSGDLYQDSKRFIYELLQNSDDSALPEIKSKVIIKLFNNTLVVAHTGKTFDEPDVVGISDVGNGTKKNATDKTGYKGIGFKSVFGQSNKVFIYSDSEIFRFDENYEHSWPSEWGGTKEEWERLDGRQFKFPWPIIPIYCYPEDINSDIWNFLEESHYTVATIIELYRPTEIDHAIEELSQKVEMFLFLKNIEEIIFQNGTEKKISINESVDGEIQISINNDSPIVFFKKTFFIDVPESVQTKLQSDKDVPDKIKQSTRAEIVFAAKRNANSFEICKASERNLYAYLPTEEKSYHIPVLVNASFYLAATRENLHKDNIWNQWLMNRVPIYLLKWISELVLTSVGVDAYTILPSKINVNDALATEYNKGLDTAKELIPFIKNSDNVLLKVGETIADTTFLSTTSFVGQTPIINYKKRTQSELNFADNPFPEGVSINKLKSFGVSTFEWRDFPNMAIMTTAFKEKMNLENNKLLISFLKYQSLSEDNNVVNDTILTGWNFILDHRMNIKPPRELYFSEIGVTPDNESNTSFIHPDLEGWLEADSETKKWLEGLEIKEKSDATFLIRTVVPKATNYATKENTIETIRKAAELLGKGEITLNIPPLLSKLKILTTQGNLIPAEECYFCDKYNPRVKLQGLITDDIFVSDEYLTANNLEKLKTLFKNMGIKEGFSLIEESRKLKETLQIEGFEQEYFNLHNNLFWAGHFTPKAYKDISKFNLLQFANIHSFSKIFWNDIIANVSIESLKNKARAFWGYTNREGYTIGDPVDNYIPWYVQNISCIPGKDGNCYTTKEIYLNTDDISKIAGSYLPVFDGPELSPEWREYFKFKNKLELKDYLKILTEIESNSEFKKSEQQQVIELILDNFTNYGPEDLTAIETWGTSGYLSDLDDINRSTKALYVSIDGSSTDLGEEYHFAHFTQAIRNHPEFENFLKRININIIRQSDFNIQTDNITSATSLIEKLEYIFPFWAQWRRDEVQGGFEQVLTELYERFNKYIFLEADELIITFGDSWKRKTDLYLSADKLYVVRKWKTMSVLMSLSHQLSHLLNAPRLKDQLVFLLFSEPKEIANYFIDKDIPLPPEDKIKEYTIVIPTATHDQPITSNDDRIIPSEFYHIPETDFDKLNYTKAIIKRAVENIIKYLDAIPEYDCSNHFVIAESVIGGITKNGNEITVVARPSDSDFTLLYYTSEFDVLEYVDAELWCEDGISAPRQITLGQLLKKTGINRIPVRNINISTEDLNKFLITPKNDQLDFNAVPFAPQKIAKIISSFANTNGGTLIFGIKEIDPHHNEIVGLSSDFRIDEITKKSISLLQPIPNIQYDWVQIEGKSVFMIKADKSTDEILLENKKYIREDAKSVVEENSMTVSITLNNLKYDKTIAIIIGIEDYHPSNQIESVKYANSDVEKFKEMLINDFEIEEDDIHTYLNEAAFKSTLEYNLKSLFHYLGENDRLIFYYVGHGFHNGITNFITTYDSHKNNISGTAVSLRSILIDPLLKSKCRNAIIFIDACAKIFYDENERSHISDINDEELILLSNDFPNYLTFLSCQSGQSSYSSDDLQNGIWTYHLIQAISGKVPEVLVNNQYVTDRLLQDYLYEAVSNYALQFEGKEQNPRAIMDSSFENVIREIVE